MLPDPKERLVDPETGETPPLSPQRGECMCLVIDDFGVCVSCDLMQFEGPDDAA